MIRKTIVVMLLVMALGTLALWPIGHTCHEGCDCVHSSGDCAWGHWIALSCCGVVGRHARVGLWSGYRIYLRTDWDGFSLALVSPFDWSPAAPDTDRECLGFGFERRSYYPPANPDYWESLGCQDVGTYDDLFTVIRFPGWFPPVVFLAYPTIAFIRGPVRRWRRRERGLCVHCGYSLTGNISGVCPECGVPPEPFNKGGISSVRIVGMIFLSALFGSACGALSYIVPTTVYGYARRGGPSSPGWLVLWGASCAVALTPIAAAFLRRRNLASAAVRMFAFGCPLFLLGEALFDCLWAFGQPTVSFPLRFIIALVAAYALPLPGIAFILPRARGLPSHCPHCGYDLTGNVSGVCPECGEGT